MKNNDYDKIIEWVNEKYRDDIARTTEPIVSSKKDMSSLTNEGLHSRRSSVANLLCSYREIEQQPYGDFSHTPPSTVNKWDRGTTSTEELLNASVYQNVNIAGEFHDISREIDKSTVSHNYRNKSHLLARKKIPLSSDHLNRFENGFVSSTPRQNTRFTSKLNLGLRDKERTQESFIDDCLSLKSTSSSISKERYSADPVHELLGSRFNGSCHVKKSSTLNNVSALNSDRKTSQVMSKDDGDYRSSLLSEEFHRLKNYYNRKKEQQSFEKAECFLDELESLIDKAKFHLQYEQKFSRKFDLISSKRDVSCGHSSSTMFSRDAHDESMQNSSHHSNTDKQTVNGSSYGQQSTNKENPYSETFLYSQNRRHESFPAYQLSSSKFIPSNDKNPLKSFVKPSNFDSVIQPDSLGKYDNSFRRDTSLRWQKDAHHFSPGLNSSIPSDMTISRVDIIARSDIPDWKLPLKDSAIVSLVGEQTENIISQELHGEVRQTQRKQSTTNSQVDNEFDNFSLVSEKEDCYSVESDDIHEIENGGDNDDDLKGDADGRDDSLTKAYIHLKNLKILINERNLLAQHSRK